jgi:hypothetical protein
MICYLILKGGRELLTLRTQNQKRRNDPIFSWKRCRCNCSESERELYRRGQEFEWSQNSQHTLNSSTTYIFSLFWSLNFIHSSVCSFTLTLTFLILIHTLAHIFSLSLVLSLSLFLKTLAIVRDVSPREELSSSVGNALQNSRKETPRLREETRTR